MRLGGWSLRAALAAAAITLGAPVLAASANAAANTFSGSCQFSGPISPDPPITVVPEPGSHFSYDGTGTCAGTLDGTDVTAAPDTVTFTHAATLFDTCELGPDVNLSGQMFVGVPPRRAQFGITINLARLAVAGPFDLLTTGGGAALGIATFTPPSTTTALQQCAGSGISTATLGGDFTTLSPLIGP